MQTTFDEDNLVANAGLQAPAALAQRLALAAVIDDQVTLPQGAPGRANCGTKALTVIGAMLAGGDSIDDVDVLRSGAGPQVFDRIRAPSTIGTWLRGFNWAAVRQLDAVSRTVLARAWAAGVGPDLDADLTIDVDSTICKTYGAKKQGQVRLHEGARLPPAAGYVRRHRRGAARADAWRQRRFGAGCGHVRARDHLTGGDAGACGQLTVRADSAFYSAAFVVACRDNDTRFSVTVKLLKPIREAIDAIPEEDWVEIDYWLEGGADVAETTYTAFKGCAQ